MAPRRSSGNVRFATHQPPSSTAVAYSARVSRPDLLLERPRPASQAESIPRQLQPAARARRTGWSHAVRAMRHKCIPTGESSALRLEIRLFRALSHANCCVISNSPWSGDLHSPTFLHLHAQGIIACNSFLAVTASFRLLYVFIVIEHRSRRLIHYNVTAHPSAAWTLQQLREVAGTTADTDSSFTIATLSFQTDSISRFGRLESRC
jgi:hypothetical protein